MSKDKENDTIADMQFFDIQFVFQWWGIFFFIGLLFLPLTGKIFSFLFDRGYIASKVLGVVTLSYLVFLFGTLHILSFTQINIILLLVWFGIFTILVFAREGIKKTGRAIFEFFKKYWAIFLLEEVLFLAGLLLWSYVRSFQPDIHGLEKFMDFGFINSILRSTYFPPRDMWYNPFPINYYYFGHLVTAVFTRLSSIPAAITFNLMVATIFALTLSLSFSIGVNLVHVVENTYKSYGKHFFQTVAGGAITAFLVTCAGNLHTIYTLFKPYQNDFPVPPWQLAFSPLTYPNSYWYPNATRFIYHTIHEFPMYSFVVSDLHGHVLDIPVVLTTILILLTILTKKKTTDKQTAQQKKQHIPLLTRITSLSTFLPENTGYFALLSFLLAVMYMTNAWDALIYFLFATVIILYICRHSVISGITNIFFVSILFFVFSLPFSLFFQPGALVGGIGMVCPPQFLIAIGRIGPFYFETNHCAHSPWWQLLILYGFFLFWAVRFGTHIYKKYKHQQTTPVDIFIGILFTLGFVLILIPEFAYMRDIYTTYFRANTMFKLVYQAFILLSIASAFIAIRLFSTTKDGTFSGRIASFSTFVISLFLFALVGVYPLLSTTSYYNNLQKPVGLNGINYIATLYPSDYLAINWLNSHIFGQPVILEAQGDSYTDYARISANTGLPTVLGWTVHEWLWRGTYDIAPPRIQDIQILYETENQEAAKQIIKKYNISLVYIGDLERKKYPHLSQEKFSTLGKVIYQQGGTTIFSLRNE